MANMEQIIKNKGRDAYYNYYRSLGYDHTTAAALSLFTYGRYRFHAFSIADLYDALYKGKEYLPKEMLEERERRERQPREFFGFAAADSASETSFARCAAPSPASAKGMNLSAAAPTAKMAERSARRKELRANQSPVRSKKIRSAFLSEEPDFSEAEVCNAVLMAPTRGSEEKLAEFERIMGFATDEYEQIEEKEARGTVAEPMSTFRMTTNTASAGVILNQLRNGRRIDRSMVRIEEMLNYFRYESVIPSDEMFHLSYELMDLENDRKYLYINVQGKEEVKERQNIIILLDVSGSMRDDAEQTQAILATIISKLGNGDKLSLVTYSTTDHVEMEAFTINGPEDRVRVLEKILSIEIEGCTYGSKGIETAYRIGKENFIPGGNNQVILITDGDLNFGITDKGGLEELIEQKKKDNLFLSVIGTGLFNYKDDKLEVLCKHGNGVYRTVNSLTDVKKSIDEEYASLVHIIAKDVKAQVEFNPEVVETYRLLGFENRTLAREDFTNDKVISEPFGSGGYGIALYELKMKTDTAPADSGLKYSRLITTGSEELGTIRIRYKEPLADVSHETEKVIPSAEPSFTDNLRLAFIVYVCAEKLRGSDKINATELALAKRLYAELGSSIREKNSADLYKLAGILEKSEAELGIGIREEPFPW